MLCVAFPSKADYTSVRSAQVLGNSQLTKVVIDLSKKANIQPLLQDDKIIVDLPEDVVWDAKTSLEEGVGRVEDYTIQRGELEIMLVPKTAINSVRYTTDNGGYQMHVDLVSSDTAKTAQTIIHKSAGQPENGKVIVRNIRIGKKNAAETRIVFDLYDAQNFNANIIDNALIVTPKSDAASGESFYLGNLDNKFPIGLLESMEIGRFNGTQQLQATLKPDVSISKSFLIEGNNPRFVVDLVSDEGAQKLDKIPSATAASEETIVHNFLKKAEVSSEVARNATPNLIVLEKHKAIAEEDPLLPLPGGAQEVKRLRIDQQHDVTSIVLELRYQEHFKVTENEYARQVMIELPKTDWHHVPVHEAHHTDVEHYFVDQSHPRMTVLVLRVKEGVIVLDRDVHTHHGKAAFSVELGHDRYGGVHWGHGTDEHWGRDHVMHRDEPEAGQNLAHVKPTLLHNEEKTVGQVKTFSFETLKPTYDPKDLFEAGNAPFADVTTGIYVGVMAGLGEGRISDTYTQSSGNLFGYKNHFFGSDGGIYAGYGHGFDRFYIGGEAFFRYMTESTQISLYKDGQTKRHEDQAHYHYGLALRLGAYISPESLFYGKIGASGMTIRHKPNAAADGQIGLLRRFNHNTAGTFYGVGIETQLSNHISARFEAMHTDCQHYVKKVGGNVSRYAPQLNQVSLGVTYKLNASYGPSSQEGIGIIPTGLYAGSGIDCAAFSVYQRIEAEDGSIFKLRGAALTPAWDFYTGYGVQYGQFYYGLEAMASLGNSYVRESAKYGDGTMNISNKRFSTYGLYFRPGYGFGHGNLVYLKLGGVMSRLKRTTTGASPLSISKEEFSKAKLGYAVGGGLEAFVTDNISVRGEYVVDFYNMNSNSTATRSEELKIFNNKFQIGVTYTL